MTLGGLALGVGMMVDGSIVVLENTFRHRDEDNEAPDMAAIKGTGEVAPAIIASTITTLVIFLPLIFVKGISGILFKELAYVIIFSLICSLMVSLSLVPMLASKLLVSAEQKVSKKKIWIRCYKIIIKPEDGTKRGRLEITDLKQHKDREISGCRTFWR